MSRQVVVDDSDSQLQYSGQGWFADQGSEDNVGNYGPTYENTLHGTKENGDSSSITVWGTTALIKIDNGTTWDPSWECFVDNVSIGSTAPFQYPENNWVLCGSSSFSDGQHTLTLKVSTSGNTFWFDYITYVPSPSVSLQSAVIMVQNTDPDVIYGSGWGALAGFANETSTVGSQVKFNFIGTGFAWYGFIPNEYPHNEAQASYSIDGGSSTTFTLNGLPSANSVTLYNQLFFTTPSLSAGSHSITVTYNGGAGSATPFTLDYILLNNVSIPSTSASGASGAGSTAVGGSATGTTSVGGSKPGTSVGATVSGATVGGTTTGGASAAGATAPGSAGSTSIGTGSLDSNPSSSGSSHSSTPIGAIVGAVVGTLALIAALLFLLWCRRRRRATSIHSQPGTGNTSAQMRTNADVYESLSSTQNFIVDPFPLIQQPLPTKTTDSVLPPIVTARSLYKDEGVGNCNLPESNVIVEAIPPLYTVD
ncbi:hypothetical protein H0H92_015769 [Tricholoma furcatifolium]|nr:hypothetical protein H0H92_015769 [Tricholoma furcatifolium]